MPSPPISQIKATPLLRQHTSTRLRAMLLLSAQAPPSMVRVAEGTGAPPDGVWEGVIKCFGVLHDSLAQTVVQLAYWHLIGGGGETRKGGTNETALMWAANMDRQGIGREEWKRLFDVVVKKHGGAGEDRGDGAGHGICSGEETPTLLSAFAAFLKDFPVYGWGEVY
ncbi:hypothetical protein B0H10DRAFT_2243425 [Mycena sp. CBHHK59/15]|nr:hypothetical protein B0H10DRAFT_2243425 [Mycena sp. CBHHK59/15]